MKKIIAAIAPLLWWAVYISTIGLASLPSPTQYTSAGVVPFVVLWQAI